MKTKTMKAVVTLALALTALVVGIAGCENNTYWDLAKKPAGPAVVTGLDLTDWVDVPEVRTVPETAFTAAQYTGTIAWETGGTAPTGYFDALTVYRAVVTLTAKPGYTFTGVAADSFTHDNKDTITNAADSGIVTIVFPPTGIPLDLTERISVPVAGVDPPQGAMRSTKYTGEVQWKTGGVPHTGPFAGGTVYTAVITFTAETGYTFEGVAENSFIHEGAETVTNTTGSDSVIVTIVFPATAP